MTDNTTTADGVLTVDLHFAIVPRWVAQADGIGPYELAVYRALADRADAAQHCWPSISTLAEDARMSRAKVKTCLVTLAGVGAISRRRQVGTDGRDGTNLYTVHRGPPHDRGGPPHDRGGSQHDHTPTESADPDGSGVSPHDRGGHSMAGGGPQHGPEVEPREVERSKPRARAQGRSNPTPRLRAESGPPGTRWDRHRQEHVPAPPPHNQATYEASFADPAPRPVPVQTEDGRWVMHA